MIPPREELLRSLGDLVLGLERILTFLPRPHVARDPE